LAASSVPLAEADANLRTVFDFADANADATANFERIDDAIMGGISLSALKNTTEDFASWSGICRTDGGGFCGMRTRPFREPLDASGSQGLFVDCRLASDDEPERRVWKITCRVDESRGEMVYQAAFPMPRGAEFSRVFVPFDDFQLVRGPRVVPGGPKLNVSNGIYQSELVHLTRFALWYQYVSQRPSYSYLLYCSPLSYMHAFIYFSRHVSQQVRHRRKYN
jgi:hypothetical protein